MDWSHATTPERRLALEHGTKKFLCPNNNINHSPRACPLEIKKTTAKGGTKKVQRVGRYWRRRSAHQSNQPVQSSETRSLLVLKTDHAIPGHVRLLALLAELEKESRRAVFGSHLGRLSEALAGTGKIPGLEFSQTLSPWKHNGAECHGSAARC
eukprot:RCo045758